MIFCKITDFFLKTTPLIVILGEQIVIFHERPLFYMNIHI